MTTPDHDSQFRFDPAAFILAWLLPGLGHLYLRQRRRGWLIMGSILAMVLIGVLVGGVDAVDRKEDSLWFAPQAVVGPITFGIDYLNVAFVKSGRLGSPGLGRVNELGTLYVGLAGLMNLIAMIDAATRRPGEPDMGRDRRARA